MRTEQHQRNDNSTPPAELSPELRNRLLSAMLDLQSVIRRNIQLRHELATRLQPQLPSGEVIARLKMGVLAEVHRQRQNERALRIWRRSLAVTGAVGGVAILLISALIAFMAAPTPIAEEPEVVMASPYPSPPGLPPVSMTKITRIYAAQPLKQKCECPCEHPRKPESSPCLMCEDILQHEGDDGSVLMIRVPNVVEFNMDKDVI